MLLKTRRCWARVLEDYGEVLAEVAVQALLAVPPMRRRWLLEEQAGQAFRRGSERW